METSLLKEKKSLRQYAALRLNRGSCKKLLCYDLVAFSAWAGSLALLTSEYKMHLPVGIEQWSDCGI